MTKLELEQNQKLFFTDYDDMDLYAEKLQVGARAWQVNKNFVEEEIDEVEELEIVYCIYRSNDMEEYDGICTVDGFVDAYKGDFCVSGEFITDDDCVYVYFKYAEESEEDIKISEVAYELYKQDWIDSHTTPAIRLESLREYFKYKKECIENDFEIDSFEEWLFENCYTKDGRSVGVYACYNEFLEEEYLDYEYMYELLLDDELIEMYFKDIR